MEIKNSSFLTKDEFTLGLVHEIMQVNSTPLHQFKHKDFTAIQGTSDCSCSSKVENLKNVLYHQYVQQYTQANGISL